MTDFHIDYHPSNFLGIDMRASAIASNLVDVWQTCQFPKYHIIEQNPLAEPFTKKGAIVTGLVGVSVTVLLDQWIQNQDKSSQGAFYALWWGMECAAIMSNRHLAPFKRLPFGGGYPVILPSLSIKF